ncbi:DMT family transporter [Aquihabitans sp. G128]|uniref:DMT family transporter n=1 Tax=Aquihabitans sp. G128 TaxID=2849779 RepID=UPI001C250384|nr:DMT family transporter [Aquihabitans sp. G128]QXC60832.1 DMT family transporter [Aquihabitans sp. G128]
MSRRGLILFGAMSLIWGLPYLLISIAVESLAPPTVVAGRTGIAALLLLPIALRQGSLKVALAHWRWIAAFGAIEMAGPFILLGHAELTLPSGLTGLLVATVPLFGAIVSFALGDRHALTRSRLLGLVLGIVGVALVVGAASGDGEVRLVNVLEVLVVAVCYAVAPFITDRKLGDVPGIGIATLSLGLVSLAYLPIAALAQDGVPTARSLSALGALAVICTAVAFVVFFALIREVGPAQATVITFVNPVVALGLGITVLDESLSLGQLLGLPVVLAGCWLAAGRSREAGPLLVAEGGATAGD